MGLFVTLVATVFLKDELQKKRYKFHILGLSIENLVQILKNGSISPIDD